MQQRRGIDAARLQAEALPAADDHAVHHLFGIARAESQACGPGLPLAHRAAPACVQRDLAKRLREWRLACSGGHAAHDHVLQRGCGTDAHDPVRLQRAPRLQSSSPRGRHDAGQVETAGEFAQIRAARARVHSAIAAAAVVIQCRRQRGRAVAQPGLRADADARAVHAHAQVDARHPHIQSEFRRRDMQPRMRDLQFAETLERLEGIAAGLLLAGQSAHAPQARRIALQDQVQPAHAQFGERTPGQQARILRDEDFGIADAQRVPGIADAQVVEPQQGPATRPFCFHAVESDLALHARTEPGGDLVGMALDQGQQLAADAVAQREQHQRRGQRIPRTAAQ